jgi:hypothetical protein
MGEDVDGMEWNARRWRREEVVTPLNTRPRLADPAGRARRLALPPLILPAGTRKPRQFRCIPAEEFRARARGRPCHGVVCTAEPDTCVLVSRIGDLEGHFVHGIVAKKLTRCLTCSSMDRSLLWSCQFA